MISRPDDSIVKKIPKKASFSVLLAGDLLYDSDFDDDKEFNEDREKAISSGSLILEDVKEYDPVKDLDNIIQMFKDTGVEELESFSVYSFPERLLYEQHAVEMRFLTINPTKVDIKNFFVKILNDEFDTVEEESVVNDRARAAVKLTGYLMSTDSEKIPDIDNVDNDPSYIYKISESATIGEEYTVKKTEYELFGYDKVFVHEFVKMPKVEGSILDKFINEGDNNGDTACI